MNHLYDQFSDNIFYPTTLAADNPDKVRALYVGYQSDAADFSAYTRLQYLSYAFSTVDSNALALQQELLHFSCHNSFLSKPGRLISLLQNNHNLQELALTNVQLTNDELDRIAGFTQLRYLSISSSNLTSVSQNWTALEQLQKLALCQCRLSSIPAAIGQLSALTSLDLSGNLLTEVPDCIAQLSNLKTLDLSECKLSTLPAWLADLPAITTINVKNNPFTELPGALKRLKSKLKIDIKSKALFDEKSREILKNKTKQITDFKDFGFKLMVIQHLMYDEKLLQPEFDVYKFVQQTENTHIDLEGDAAYEVLPDVKAYFQQLAIPEYLLEDISKLCADGGDKVYQQLAPRWSGSEDYFLMHSAADIRLLPKLKTIESAFLTESFITEAGKRDIELIGV